MSIFQRLTKTSFIKGSALLIVLAGAEGTYAMKWGIFGFFLTGIPLWCFGALASTGGILFFLGPMIFGSDPVISTEQLSKDQKLLFLYLRPFELDARNILQLTVGASVGVLVYTGLLNGVWWPLSFAPLIVDISKEQAFGNAFEPLGEFITFGSPREKLSPIGASRVYAGDDWRQVISNYMTKARLVIVRPGRSDSIRWEIERALTIVPPERILFYLRFRGSRKKREDAYADFRNLVHLKSPARLPEHLGKSLYLIFDRSWNPFFIREANRPTELIRQAISPSANIVTDRFEPVLRALGIEVPSRNNNLLGRVVAVLPWLVAALAIGLVLVTLVLAIIKVLTALTIYLFNQH
jgi:hypothetical protein